MGCCSSKLIFTNETKSLNKDSQNNITEENKNKEKNESKIEYRNKINLIYSVKSKGEYNILGKLFVYKNKDNLELILNDKQNELITKQKKTRSVLSDFS